MNVLIIHNAYQKPGGEDVVVAQESKLLEHHGHNVTLYLRSNNELEGLTLGQRLGLIGRIISAKDSKLAVRGILRELKPDVVHIHNTFAMVSPSVYEACQQEDVPVVQTLHNYRLLCPAATFYRNGKICQDCVTDGLLRSVQHACYRESRLMTGAIALMLKAQRVRETWNSRIDAYIALSRFAKDRFVQCGFPASKIYIKPNFVEPDPGERVYCGNYALFVGRLSPEKGLLTLLKAWQSLPSHVPLLIVGDGPMRPFLEAEVVKAGLHWVRFAGQLNRDEVYERMKKAAFLIVPSVWEEPFGLIVAEAFACGTPVLGASIGSIQEMLDDQVTGLRFAPGDPNALAKKVAWAWDHPHRLQAMGETARGVYEDRYTGSANYKLLLEIYASAIEGHFRFKRKRPLRAAA
jgi:glycosyltransferase involved in cell wall biosynthesis